MIIPSKSEHISHKKAVELKETTDLFGLPLKIGDQCVVFRENEAGFTGTKDVSALHGIIKEIEVFPTLVAEVTVEHYVYSEEERKHPDYKQYKNEKNTHSYYNTGVLGTTVLREARPEYFL